MARYGTCDKPLPGRITTKLSRYTTPLSVIGAQRVNVPWNLAWIRWQFWEISVHFQYTISMCKNSNSIHLSMGKSALSLLIIGCQNFCTHNTDRVQGVQRSEYQTDVGWEGEWVSEWVNEWVSEWVGGWVSVSHFWQFHKYNIHSHSPFCDLYNNYSTKPLGHITWTFGFSLTHTPLDKMAAILADDIFKCLFLNENGRIPIQISLKFVPRSPIDNKQALVKVMAWCRLSDRPLPEPRMAQFTDSYMRRWGGDELI